MSDPEQRQSERPGNEAGGEDKRRSNSQREALAGAWIAIGVGVGVALGASFDNVGLGVALGAAVGAGMSAVQYGYSRRK